VIRITVAVKDDVHTPASMRENAQLKKFEKRCWQTYCTFRNEKSAMMCSKINQLFLKFSIQQAKYSFDTL